MRPLKQKGCLRNMNNKELEVTAAQRQEIYNDPDLKWIITQRTLVRFLVSFSEIEKEKYEEKVKPILVKEIESFIKNELKRYRRKNNSDYLSDIKKARGEDDKYSLLNLLEWDKAWLKMDWVVEKIIQAQEKDDFDFLKSVGNAIAKQPGSSSTPMTEKGAVKDIKILCDFFDIRKEDHHLIKDLHYRLAKAGKISDKKTDYNYFVKWLSRHKIV